MRRGMLLLGFWVCVCMVFLVNAQEHTSRKLYCTDEDRAIFDRYCTQMEPKKSLPLDELMIHTALFFRGTPYVASTLEKEPEGLVVNLRELDCTTFAETVLALSRTLREEKTTFENFCENLQQLRYRDGTIHDYTDRLHYMTDWFYENERKGIVKDMGREIGGASLPLDLSFISTHPDSYKQLKNHPEREKQMAYNEAHGITPKQVMKNSVSMLAEKQQTAEPYAYIEPEPSLVADPVVQYMNRTQLEKAIERTRKQMTEAAKKLDFIEAAQFRDELVKLEDLLKTKKD